MRSVLDCPSAELLDWREDVIEYRVYLPGRSLARISGTARCGSDQRKWSVVRKTGVSVREVSAYRAAWLDSTAGFRPARAYMAARDEIWLEDVPDIYGRHWPLEAFDVAGAALGRFNGTHLLSPPVDEPWLSRDWMDKHQDLPALANRPGDYGMQMNLRNILDAQPQTICHHDASQANLFISAGEVVAIDWENVGWGAVGADLATLVVGTMRRGDFDAQRAKELDEVAFRGYARGLAEAGWRDAVAARRGYAAAVALRWSIVASAPGSPLARFVLARQEEVRS